MDVYIFIYIGLSEILTVATRKQTEEYLPMIIIALNQALCDECDEVRIQAAKAFQTLFRSVGGKAIEQVSSQNYDPYLSKFIYVVYLTYYNCNYYICIYIPVLILIFYLYHTQNYDLFLSHSSLTLYILHILYICIYTHLFTYMHILFTHPIYSHASCLYTYTYSYMYTDRP